MKNKRHTIFIKAHAVTGESTMSQHIEKMHHACQKAACNDERFTKMESGDRGVPFTQRPYVVDITTPDEKGKHHAIIRTAKGELVRHGFDFNKDLGTATFIEGDSKPTESTRVYASAIERHDNMIQATAEFLSCRGTNGTKLDLSEPWVSGKAVSYIYVPAGISTISAGFRRNESITCTVEVDEITAKDLQESFDYIAATEKQEPYADEDHEGKKATLRFPAEKVKFVYGTLRGEEGIIVQGAEPTNYGAEAVNGKTYRSWSPEFATDANYAKAKCKKGHWTFPDGVRGSASNPAKIVAVSFVTGALTNKPAFKNMPPVKAAKVEVEDEVPRFVKAAKEADSITLNDLQSAVNKVAAEDSRFKPTDKTGFCWCCDLILSGDSDWSAIIQANGKTWEVPFTIDDENKVTITLGSSEKEVARKTNYVTACEKKEFLLNGEVIKAAWSDAAREAANEARKSKAHATAHSLSALAHEATHIANGLGSKANHSAAAAAHEKAYQAHSYPASENKKLAKLHDDLRQHHETSFSNAKNENDYKIKKPTGIYKEGSEPTHGVYRESSLKQHGEKATAISHHWDEKSAHEAAKKISDSKVVEYQKASETMTPIDVILARRDSEREVADAIAMKSPEIQAREAKKSEKPNPTIETILARNAASQNFIDGLIERNPAVKNRDALEKIASQKI